MTIFKGSIPAVITPFLYNYEIDFDSLEKHIEFLISEGSHGLVSCGTTGESPTLDHDEHKKITEFIIQKARSRVPVMAGCGSNSTKESIDLVRHANLSKADGVLLVTPYYNKPTQEGIYQHFKEIAFSCEKMPIYLYNIPGRSIVEISAQTTKKLSKINNIVGVKDATGDLNTPLEIFDLCGRNFHQISGEDSTFLAFLASGGIGCISVAANVIPKFSSQIFNFWENGNILEAMKLNHKIYNLNKSLFIETSPSPVKYAMSKLNKCNNILRLPLVSISKETEKEIDLSLEKLDLI